MVLGTVATLTLIYLSPTIQVDILKHETAMFPLRNPALITMPLAFSITDGIAFGFIAYAVLKPATGRARELHWLAYVFAAVFVLRYMGTEVFSTGFARAVPEVLPGIRPEDLWHL